MTVSPTNNIRNSTCEDSTSGYMNSDSRKAGSDTFRPAQWLRELLVAVGADIVDVAANREQRILVLGLDGLPGAIAGVDHVAGVRDPFLRSTRSRRQHQQVAGFGKLN